MNNISTKVKKRKNIKESKIIDNVLMEKNPVILQIHDHIFFFFYFYFIAECK